MLTAGILGASASSSTGSSCAQRQAAEAAYAKGMAKARAAYFETHKAAAARRTFVTAQKAKLTSLEVLALCSTTPTTDSSPLPAPAPTANEHFVFGDDMSQSARDELQSYVTFAVQDEQTLLGVELGDLHVFASTDAAWLAQQQCAFSGQAGSCVSDTEASYASGNSSGNGLGAIFIYWGSSEWAPTADVYVKQKVVGHEVAGAFAHKLDGRHDDADQPVWLIFGPLEMLGYHVTSDRRFRPYADSLKDMRQNIKALTTPLEHVITWSDYGLVGHWYLAGAADRLVTDAPNGIRSLVDYYTALGKQEPWQDAFQSAFGMSPDAFYADFAAYKAGL